MAFTVVVAGQQQLEGEMAEQAGVWLRVSTSAQNEQNQVPDVMAWVKDHEYNVTRTYTLKKSAWKGEHAATLAEMLEDMRKGYISVLVVWKSDRIERRGPRFAFNLIEDVRKAGGRIEFVTETYLNADGPAAELMTANMSVMAREESRKRSERVNIGLGTSRANGAATGRPPWGYRTTGAKHEKRFVPTADGKRWVPEMFTRVAGGESIASVARWLTEQHAGGKKWSTVHVWKLLRNPAMKGTVVNSAGLIVHRCEPLVDAALWQRANVAMKARERKHYGRGAKAMLAGVAVCGYCGAPSYRTHSESQTRRYYRCSATPSCGMVATVLVEAAVNKIAAEAFNAPVKATQLIPGQTYDAEIQDVRFELQHLDLDAEDYDQQHAELRARLAELKSLPSIPDRWEEVELDRTYADEWATVPEQERAVWLKKHRFHVWITRERVTMLQGGGPWDEGWVPVADLLPALDKAGSAHGRVAHTADV